MADSVKWVWHPSFKWSRIHQLSLFVVAEVDVYLSCQAALCHAHLHSSLSCLQTHSLNLGIYLSWEISSPSDMSVLQTWILISNSLTLEHSPVGSRRMFSHHSSDGAYRCQTLTRLWSYNKWELCDWKYKVMWQIAIMMMIWNVFADKWLRLINRLWRITRTTSAAGMIPCMRFA